MLELTIILSSKFPKDLSIDVKIAYAEAVSKDIAKDYTIDISFSHLANQGFLFILTTYI